MSRANELRDDGKWVEAESLYSQILQNPKFLEHPSEFTIDTKLNYAFALEQWASEEESENTADARNHRHQSELLYQEALKTEDAGKSALARNNLARLLVLRSDYRRAADLLRETDRFSGKLEAGIMAHYRFNLAQTLRKWGENRSSAGGFPKNGWEEACLAYRKSIRADAHIRDAVAGIIRLADDSHGHWQHVKEAIYTAVNSGNAPDLAPEIQKAVIRDISTKQVNVLLGAWLLVNDASMPGLTRLREDWAEMNKGSNSRTRKQIQELGEILGTVDAGEHGDKQFRKICGVLDDEYTCSSFIGQVADQFARKCGASTSCDHEPALSRYVAAWKIVPENTDAAFSTAVILTTATDTVTEAQKEPLSRELLTRYSFPPSRWRYLLPPIKDAPAAQFAAFNDGDLDIICQMRVLLGDTTCPRVEQEKTARAGAALSGQFTAIDGSRIVSGKLSESDGKDVAAVKVEIRQYWPEGLRVGKAAVDPTTRTFSARFRRRAVSDQTVTISNLRDGRLVANPFRVKPQKASAIWGDWGDWGSLRVYLQAGIAGLVGTGANGAAPYGNLTFDKYWATWSAENILPPASGGAHARPFTALFQTFGSVETAPIVIKSILRTDLTASQQQTLRQIGSQYALTFEGGAYAPVFHRRMIGHHHDRPYAAFAAPLALAGTQIFRSSTTLPGGVGPTAPFAAYGVRFGVLRFVTADEQLSPSLVANFDVVSGHWDRLGLKRGTLPLESASGMQISANFKIPTVLAAVGFSWNVGQGLNDVRFTLATRLDLGKAFAKAASVWAR